MKLRFDIDQAAALRRGVDAPTSWAVIHVDPKSLTEPQRNLIADRLQGIDVMQRCVIPGGPPKFPRIKADAGDLISLMAAIESDERQYRAVTRTSAPTPMIKTIALILLGLSLTSAFAADKPAVTKKPSPAPTEGVGEALTGDVTAHSVTGDGAESRLWTYSPTNIYLLKEAPGAIYVVSTNLHFVPATFPSLFKGLTAVDLRQFLVASSVLATAREPKIEAYSEYTDAQGRRQYRSEADAWEVMSRDVAARSQLLRDYLSILDRLATRLPPATTNAAPASGKP